MPNSGYYRARHLSRVAAFVFVVLAGIFLFWAIPWLPGGLSASDYTPKLAFTVYLLGGVAAAGACTLALRRLALQHEELLVVRTSLIDEAGGVRSATFFYDRLVLECARASRHGSSFSVLLFDVWSRSSTFKESVLVRDDALHLAGQLAAEVVELGVVALLAKDELGVLALGVRAQDRQQLADKLCMAVAVELGARLCLPGPVDVGVGASTYGVEGREPMALLGAARKAARIRPPVDDEALSSAGFPRREG